MKILNAMLIDPNERGTDEEDPTNTDPEEDK